MDISGLSIALILPILLVLCGIGSATETVLFSLTFHDRMRLRRRSPRAAKAVDEILRAPREFLITTLLFNMLASTLYFVLTSLLAAQMQELWQQIVLGAVNLLLMTLMAEVVSKIVAARFRVELARVAAPGLVIAFRTVKPLRRFLARGIIEPLARLVGTPDPAAAKLTTDELGALLQLGTKQGALADDEGNTLRQVIHFGGQKLRDIMIPRVDVLHLKTETTLEDVRIMVRQTGLTRIPICRDGLDSEVLGLLNTKGYLAASERRPGVALTAHIEPVGYVPETASLDKLLEHFRTNAVKQALCVNERGVVSGLIAIQDVAARLIAELSGTGDDGEAAPQVQLVGLGRWRVSGRTPARDLAEMFESRAEDRASTVAGLIMAKLGRLPLVGDVVTLGNVRLEVTSLEGRVVGEAIVSLAEANGTDGISGAAQGVST